MCEIWFCCCHSRCLLTPPSFGHLPYILLRKTPRNAAGHGRGGLCYKGLSFPAKKSPCYTNSLYLFILLNSEKNEPRSAAAVIGPFGLSLRSPSGGCGTRSAQTVLALFPPSSLRLHRPIKADRGLCFCLYSNPLALRALPLYSLQEHRARGWKYHIIFDWGGRGIKGQSPLIIDWVLFSRLDPTIFA